MRTDRKNKQLINQLRRYDQKYFEAERELSSSRINNTVALLGNINGKSILDLGCGTGEGSIVLRKLGAKVVCLDAARYAMTTCTRLEFEGVLAVAHSLPFRERSFDGVLLMDVIEHIPKNLERQFLLETKRVTKPDGKIAIHTMPNLFLEKLSMIYGQINKKHWRRWGVQGGHINTHTSWRLRKELRSAGLEILEFKIGAYSSNTPFSRFVSTFSRFSRRLFGNDFWVCCKVPRNSECKSVQQAK